MGKEQEGSLGGRQKNVPSGARLDQYAGSGVPMEQALAPAAPRLEPVEIFPGQPPQQGEIPTFRKSEKMRAVEATHGAPGESLADILRRLYHGEGKTLVEMASVLGMKQLTVGRWMRELGIQSVKVAGGRRSGWHDSEATKQKKADAARRRWKDPEEHERMLARIRSEEARRQRIDALKRFYATEEGRRSRREAAAKGRETRKGNKLAKLRETLGGDPTEILRRMYWDQGLTVEQIAERIDRSVAETQKLMRYASVGIREEDKLGKREKVGGSVKKENREVFEKAFKAGLISTLPEKWRYILAVRYLTKKPTTLAEIGRKYHQTREWVRQIEKRALRGLRRMLAGEEIQYRVGQRGSVVQIPAKRL